MKINVIGTGTMGSITRGNQSILVDDILFDCGSGVVKKLEQMKLYTKYVNYLVLTHAHSDHFCDIPNYLIGRNIRGENKETLEIICGKGLKEKTIELFILCFGYKGDDFDFEKTYNVHFNELENGDIFETDSFKLTAYELEHGPCKPILGFTLEKDGKVLGYATDTTVCDNVDKICEKSNIVFLDATNTVPTNSHMGLDEVIEYSRKYSNIDIYAIHRSDYVHSHITELKFPEDGEEIIL